MPGATDSTSTPAETAATLGSSQRAARPSRRADARSTLGSNGDGANSVTCRRTRQVNRIRLCWATRTRSPPRPGLSRAAARSASVSSTSSSTGGGGAYPDTSNRTAAVGPSSCRSRSIWASVSGSAAACSSRPQKSSSWAMTATVSSRSSVRSRSTWAVSTSNRRASWAASACRSRCSSRASARVRRRSRSRSQGGSRSGPLSCVHSTPHPRRTDADHSHPGARTVAVVERAPGPAGRRADRFARLARISRRPRARPGRTG